MKGHFRVRDILDRLVDLLIREYRPERIVLFGSYASGEPHEDSDVDLLIVKDIDLPFHKRGPQVRRLIRDVRRLLPMDIIVLTPQEVSTQLQQGNVFLAEILEEGEVLYDRARVTVS